MKAFLILGAAALACASPTLAKESPCLTMGSLAETVMAKRQSGTPMSTLMQLAEQFPEARSLIAVIVKAAYAHPRYETAEYQQREIENFRNEIEAECYK